MQRLTIEEVKVLQLDVLQAIHEFCTQNSIKYSLGCGSMLGCARHQGYIPWDDDIDIYIPRSDYQRLISIFPKVYKGKYELISLERNDNWKRPYAKASDNTTRFIENVSGQFEIGVNIDIYPIDFVPDNEKEWLSYNKKRRFFQHLMEFKYVKFRKNRSFHRNVGLLLGKFILLPISEKKLALFLNYYAQIHNKTCRNRMFECVQGLFQKKPFPARLFDDIILLPFEDRRFMAFNNYDEYLTNGYGDWRQLPPIEKQVAHHDFQAYRK